MKPNALRMLAFRSFAMVVVLGATWQAQGQGARSPYPSMAPIEQYLMERNAEIALARSAAPESISRDAEVMPACAASTAKRSYLSHLMIQAVTSFVRSPDGPICRA